MYALSAVVLAAAASAAPTRPPAPAPKVAAQIALLPIDAITKGVGSLATIESLVVASARELGSPVTTPAEVRGILAEARRPDLATCEGDAVCLAAIGQLVGATTIVTGEVGAIGDGLVVYLGAFDVAQGARTGSTSATLTGDPATRTRAVREAVTRLLAPERHTGRLSVRAPRVGAQVYVDGRLLGATPLDARISAGTHALRVTHPQTRDLVRFVDVPFEETTSVDAGLVDLPVVTDVTGRRKGAAGGDEGRPWFRGWWAPVAVGVGAAIVTTVIVTSLSSSGPDVDDTVSIPPP